MSDPTPLVLTAGALFHERYRVVRTINAGGMGAVYEVIDTRTSSPRALKVILANLLADPDVRARFAQEATITGGILSEHLVQITDAGVDPATATPFLVMDLLHGSDLGRLVEERGTFSSSEVVRFLYQAGLALDKTHAASIIHRDLKPENLFVVLRDDGAPFVKVLDFGIAKLVAEGRRATETRSLGTPLYMSPEQISGTGEIGPRADVYAVGHIAYTLLVGEPFWSPEADASPALYTLLARIMVGSDEGAGARARHRRQITLPRAFDGWFRRVTALAPEDRFDSVGAAVIELAAALAVPLPGPTASSIEAGRALTGVDFGHTLRTSPRAPRRTARWMAAAALALGAAAALGLALRPRHLPSGAGVRPPQPAIVAPARDVLAAASSAVIILPDRSAPEPIAPDPMAPDAATPEPVASVVPTVKSSARAPASARTAPPPKPPAPHDEGIY